MSKYQMFNLFVLSSRMQTAEAELLYIKEVEKLDGFGQESFPAKVDKNTTPPSSHTDTHTSTEEPVSLILRRVFFVLIIFTLLSQDNYTNDIFIGVSFIGVFVKHRNGRSIMLHK